MRSIFAGAVPGIVLGIVLGGCATVEERQRDQTVAAADKVLSSSGGRKTHRKASAGARVIHAKTIIPETFSTTLPSSPAPAMRAVPKSMLAVAEVIRPRAELREGPGADFLLLDQLLSEGTKVLVFSRVGVWQKVLVPGTWVRGWVHSQALSQERPSERAMEIDMSHLPTVLAVREVESARTFPSLGEIRVAVPRGAMFRSLMANDWGTLVWLPETNSVIWMARKDVQ